MKPAVFIFVLLCSIAVVALGTGLPWSDTDRQNLSGLLPADRAARLAPVLAIQEQDRPRPQAVVDHCEYDFGVLDPFTSGSHFFEIRNEGQVPLELRQGETTCKCTISNVQDSRIEPGASGRVTLEWNTGKSSLRYDHGALIHTNDPLRPEIQLQVRGQIRAYLVATPEDIVLPRILPHETTTTEVVVYSQVLDRCEIDKIDSTLTGLEWQISPLEGNLFDGLKITAGQRIRLTLPNSLPEGYFQETLRLWVKCDEDRSPEALELPLHGKVVRRLSIYGKGMYSDGILRLGEIPEGQGKSVKLMFKVRDEVPQLNLLSYQVEPAIANVSMEPHNPGEPNAGLYDLTIEIPPETSAFRLPTLRLGVIRLQFDHPRINDEIISFDLAIEPKGGCLNQR